MTNLVASIALSIVTNWTTVSVTRPVCGQSGCLVIHYDTHHQIGSRVTNTVARFVWKGKTIESILESTEPVADGKLKQDISVGQSLTLSYPNFTLPNIASLSK